MVPRPTPTPAPAPRRWDLFCRVIDNFGDIGVCWRLARQLAAAGQRVRLITDDHSALQWMAPAGDSGIEVRAWPGPGNAAEAPDAAEVVIEAFGCDPPAAYVQAMAAAAAAPVWINLEYLSAEGYVERSHGLPSPRADGLRKWFFYPGFTEHTGGLLREPGLLARREAFRREPWLCGLGLPPRQGERLVSLFCYDNPVLPALVQALGDAPTLLLLTPGPARRQVRALPALPPLVRAADLPWLDQADFDHLLWACDLNCVRGEDSWVRALWAGAPSLWQAYPQGDGAHAAKVGAAIERLAWPADVARAWRGWNGLAPWAGLPSVAGWREATIAARARLAAQDDLVTRLMGFVEGQMAAGKAARVQAG